MCIGIPMQLTEVDGLIGVAHDGRSRKPIDLALTGPLAPGTWVLTFLGTAREVLTEDDALRIRAAVDSLRAVMAGEDPGHDAFADIEERGPQLPPHLQAARDAGRGIA